ncbi:MAG: 2-C-methyl-D-erythritol 4-phosphate cytidylyltransferase [Candidatus Epulonipiscioides saccharophilum]|nr:MAG: 2-C-methyl-D-erythritol 4-phosphate cytidylyltransferase [Epulopiscium sp. AS2M-Bin001]
MIYASIVAGGLGSRMGDTNLPKQFLRLNDKPILIYSIQKFFDIMDITKIFVLVPESYVEYTEELVKKFIGHSERIIILKGGINRNDTVMNSIRYIQDNLGIDKNDICITHDAARPFVTEEIILENIEKASRFGAVTTAVQATDTILISLDNDRIDKVPQRDNMYQCQTPQTFNINLLLKCYERLTDEEKEKLTDVTKIFILQGETVKIAKGEYFNIKITTQTDLIVAESILFKC